jgi:hypothetical protein
VVTNASINCSFLHKLLSTVAGGTVGVIIQVAEGVCLSSFRHVTLADISSAIEHLPDKSSAADPLPTGILSRVADLLLPFFAYPFNLSFDCGTFPSCFKDAFLTPVLKKLGLPASDPTSYISAYFQFVCYI